MRQLGLDETQEMIETNGMIPNKEQIYEAHGAVPPEVLEQMVNELPDIPDIDLADYSAAIKQLHDAKCYSFREIVAYLMEHGIVTNRSAVYRVYKEASLPAAPSEPGDEENEPLVDDDTGEVVEP